MHVCRGNAQGGLYLPPSRSLCRNINSGCLCLCLCPPVFAYICTRVCIGIQVCLSPCVCMSILTRVSVRARTSQRVGRAFLVRTSVKDAVCANFPSSSFSSTCLSSLPGGNDERGEVIVSYVCDVLFSSAAVGLSKSSAVVHCTPGSRDTTSSHKQYLCESTQASFL